MTTGRTITSLNKDWCTPAKYVAAIREFFGGEVDLDPCSNQHSIVHAGVEYKLPAHDGLLENWDFPRIYVNPPYGADRERGTTIKNWLRKCAKQIRNTAQKCSLLCRSPRTRAIGSCMFGGLLRQPHFFTTHASSFLKAAELAVKVRRCLALWFIGDLSRSDSLKFLRGLALWLNCNHCMEKYWAQRTACLCSGGVARAEALRWRAETGSAGTRRCRELVHCIRRAPIVTSRT